MTLLESKHAVIYGGGGAIGGAVARAFAREGATVHLAGRTQASLDAVADDIRSRGGRAETAVLDALDEEAVDAHAGSMPRVDISFNVISHGDVQGTPLAEMSLADFERPVVTAVRTMFITTRAAARHMMSQRSGVILVFGGYGDPLRDHNLGGLQVAFGAQEYLRRNLAAELGPYGIRVLTLQTGGVPETIPDGFAGKEAIVRSLVAPTLLGRTATLEDVGNVAAFAASDWARTMTGSALNITCGTEIG
jgi:3-oxoacyl-[acyl-carrier protein] reductase